MTVGRGQGQSSSQDIKYISTRALGEPFGWDTEEMTRRGARTRVAAVTMLSMAGLAAIAFDPRPENGIQVAASSSQPENAPLRVTAETKLPGAPAGIAIGDGSVWVTTYDQVVRLDVGTAEIRDQIGPYGDKVVFVGHGIVVADDRVWVASPTTVDGHDHGDYQGAVVRIDPSTGSVDGELRDEDDSPSAITALEGRVWVAGWSETFKLVKRKADGYERMITLGQPVSGLASGHGALWTVSPSEGLVLRIDPDSGEATRFDLGGPRENLRVAAVGADGIWAADDESVIEFDPLTGVVRQEIKVGRIQDAALADETLWIYREDGVLALDASSGEVAGRLPLPGRNLGKITARDGQAWITDYVGEVVRRIERG